MTRSQQLYLPFSLIFVIIYQVALLGIAAYLFGDMTVGLLICLCGISVILFQSYLMRIIGYGPALIFSLCGFIFINLVFKQIGLILWFMASLGVFLFSKKNHKETKSGLTKKELVFGSLSMIIFAFLSSKVLLYRALRHADPNGFLNHFLLGTIGQDQLFQISLATMIKEYLIPSTGLHGTPLFIGSYFGEMVLAALSAATDFEVYQVFAFLVPFFAFPLLLFLFFDFLKNKNLHLLFLLIFGLFSFGEHPWMGFDPSILFSYLFIICLFIAAYRKESLWWSPILVLLTFWAKFNVGIVAFGLAGWQGINLFCLNRKKALVYFILLFCLGLFSFKFFFPVFYDNTGSFSWWWYYKFIHHNQINLKSALLFCWNFLSLPVLYFISAGILCFQQGLVWLKKEHIPFIFVIGMFLGAFLAIHLINVANSNMHFFQLAQFLTVPLLVKNLVIIKMPTHIKMTFFTLGAVLVSLSLSTRLEEHFHFKNLKEEDFTNFVKSFEPSLIGNEQTKIAGILPYIEALERINKQTPKNILVEIPEELSVFWTHSIFKTRSVRHWMAFYIPIFAKRPAWKGYNEAFMKKTPVAWYPPGFYGYNVYYEQQAKDVCADTAFDGVARVILKQDDSVDFETIYCESKH